MALVVKDRVKETSTTTGTGTYTLAGAATGFQSFAGIGNGNTTYYCVTDGTNWEVNLGTYTSSGTTLSRDTLLASSTGSFISWSAGSKDVFVVYPAGRAVMSDSAGVVSAPAFVATNGLVVNSATVSSSYSIPSGSNAMSVGPITVASGQSVTVPSGQRWVVL